MSVRVNFHLRQILHTLPPAYEWRVEVEGAKEAPPVKVFHREEVEQMIAALRSKEPVIELPGARIEGINPSRHKLAEYLELVIS